MINGIIFIVIGIIFLIVPKLDRIKAYMIEQGNSILKHIIIFNGDITWIFFIGTGTLSIFTSLVIHYVDVLSCRLIPILIE